MRTEITLTVWKNQERNKWAQAVAEHRIDLVTSEDIGGETITRRLYQRKGYEEVFYKGSFYRVSGGRSPFHISVYEV